MMLNNNLLFLVLSFFPQLLLCAGVATFEAYQVTTTSLVIRMINGNNVSSFDMTVQIFDLDRLIEYRKTELKDSHNDQLFSFDGLTASTWFAFRIHYHLHPDHPSVHNRGRKQELIVRTKSTVSEDPSKVNDSIAFIDDLFITKDNIYIGVASVFKDTKKVITVIVPELRCEKGVLKPLAQQVVNHASFHFDLTLLGESNSNCSRICVFPFVRVSIVNRTSETFKGREWCGGIEDAKKLIKFSTNYPHLLFLSCLLVFSYLLFT